MLDRLMVYGSRDKGADTGLLTLGFLILLLVFISSSDVLEESQTQEEVAASSIVPDGALLLFRLSCVVLVVITLSWIALDPLSSSALRLRSTSRRSEKFTNWSKAFLLTWPAI